MKTWFTSLNGAVTLSTLSLLAFIGYALMEMRYYLAKWIPGDTAAAVELFVVLLIVGGWIRALFVTANGRRGGLIALLALSVVFALIAPYDFQFIPMPWPEQTMVFATFVFSLIAIAALALRLRQTK
ncbi:MAG: hypothetical protein HYZ24_14530 [Chloroflexi bacterium]|nr:hypothetical protein [Chloroflexota bacterium]